MDRSSADKFDAFLKSKGTSNYKKVATTDYFDDKPAKSVALLRFSDDLTVKDGQKMTPELIHKKPYFNSIDNARQEVECTLYLYNSLSFFFLLIIRTALLFSKWVHEFFFKISNP